jgi:hypothetical protein
MLPANLPSSIYFHNWNDDQKAKAFCQYSIKAELKLRSWFGKSLKYKQILTIHEPPVAFTPDAYLQQTADIATCCCMAKGTCGLEVKFNKNVFYSNETAFADVRVDNSKCLLNVNTVEFEVKQVL